MYGVRTCSNFTLLHIAVQFSQHYLMKRLSLPPLYILASFVKNKIPIGAWVYFWVFYLVPLVYISVFVPVLCCLDDCSFVVYSEVGKVDSSSSILLSQDCFYASFLILHFCLCCHFSHVQLFVTPGTVARQASLSMGIL